MFEGIAERARALENGSPKRPSLNDVFLQVTGRELRE
jgi:hypothetical protein